MAMSDLQRYRHKLCLFKFELDINDFVSNLFIFICGFTVHKLTEINFLSQNIFPTFLIRLGFKGTVVNQTLPSLHKGSLEIIILKLH